MGDLFCLDLPHEKEERKKILNKLGEYFTLLKDEDSIPIENYCCVVLSMRTATCFLYERRCSIGITNIGTHVNSLEELLSKYTQYILTK